jgi:hypothetical protein
MFSGTGLAAFALARTAGRTQLEATVMGRAKLRTVHALAMLAARLMPGVPAASLHYVAAVARVGVPAFAAAMALGAPVRTAPYAVLGQGIAGVARHDPDRRLGLPDIEGAGRAVARPPPPECQSTSQVSIRSPASCVTSPRLPRE